MADPLRFKQDSKAESPEQESDDGAGTEAASTRLYRVGPFVLRSELALPELRAAGHFTGRAVQVRRGKVPNGVVGAAWVDSFCCLTEREWMLYVPGVARYHVADGRRVTVEPESGAAEGDVRIYMLGSCFGVLCYQNGLIPLHASAVAQQGQVTAFLGESGAGKSTLAASLARRGYTIVSDDICLLERVSDGWRVHPVAGWLKLWRASLDRLGEAVEESNRVLSEQDKYRLYLGPEPETDLRLRDLVFLDRPALGRAEAALPRMANAEAVGRLFGAVYLPYYLEAVEGLPAMFHACSAVLAGASPFRLDVPLGWEYLEGVLDLVERSLLRQEPEAAET